MHTSLKPITPTITVEQSLELAKLSAFGDTHSKQDLLDLLKLVLAEYYRLSNFRTVVTARDMLGVPITDKYLQRFQATEPESTNLAGTLEAELAILLNTLEDRGNQDVTDN